MKKGVTLAAISGLIYLSAAYAHLCNNVYRSPDRLIVKPEKPVTSVDKSEEVRVFVKNNFPVTINDVRLTAKSDDDNVQVEVTPESLDAMKPGDKMDFKLNIKVADGAPAKKHKISIGLAAKQIGFEALDESPVPKLRQIVETPKTNQSTQVLAAEALAKREDPVGFQFLKNMAANNKSPDYRARAIRGIGRVGHKSTLSFLRELLQDRDGYVKGNAIIALALSKSQTMTLQRGLSDRDPFVKTCSLAALTYRGGKTHLAALKKALEDNDECVQVAAAWGLASAGEKEGVDRLDKMISGGTKDVKVRIFAGESLISLPDRDMDSKAKAD